jgi:hypothetical protein
MSLMRRAVSILMVILFWLAPVSLLLPGSDEAHLPMCCRRHGAHHCAMSADGARATESAPIVAAPDHCPRYCCAATAANAAFALAIHRFAVSRSGVLFPTPALSRVYSGQPRSQSGRSPPAIL